LVKVQLQMERVWVTGAVGFLGRALVQKFADAGSFVAGIGNTGGVDATLEGVPLGTIGGRRAWVGTAINVDSLEALHKMTGCPDLVLHAAGRASVGPSLTDPLADYYSSVEVTAVILDFLRRRAPHARFIFPSSAAVYGVRPRGPISEDTVSIPISPYGAHKLAAECLIGAATRVFGQNCVIIRYFSLYGPGLKRQLLWDISNRLKENPNQILLSGTGDETRDLIHIDDAVELAYRSALYRGGNFLLVNGGTGTSLSVRDLAQVLISSLGKQVAIRFTQTQRLGDPPHLEADTKLTKQLLCFVPNHTLESGMLTYAKWVRRELAKDECGNSNE
jgi:UDP-glucose 4-epimerase